MSIARIPNITRGPYVEQGKRIIIMLHQFDIMAMKLNEHCCGKVCIS